MERTKNQIEVEGKKVAAKLEKKAAEAKAFFAALDTDTEGNLEPEYAEVINEECYELDNQLQALRAEWKAAA